MACFAARIIIIVGCALITRTKASPATANISTILMLIKLAFELTPRRAAVICAPLPRLLARRLFMLIVVTFSPIFTLSDDGTLHSLCSSDGVTRYCKRFQFQLSSALQIRCDKLWRWCSVSTSRHSSISRGRGSRADDRPITDSRRQKGFSD